MILKARYYRILEELVVSIPLNILSNAGMPSTSDHDFIILQ